MFSVVLVGGDADYKGNVFATNQKKGIFGPVCADHWDSFAVKLFSHIQIERDLVVKV